MRIATIMPTRPHPPPLPPSDFTELIHLLADFYSKFYEFYWEHSAEHPDALSNNNQLAKLHRQAAEIDSHYGWVLAGDRWRLEVPGRRTKVVLERYNALRTALDRFGVEWPVYIELGYLLLY